MDSGTNGEEILATLLETIGDLVYFFVVLSWYMRNRSETRATTANLFGLKYSLSHRIPKQINQLRDVVEVTDVACINNLRMDRNAFGRLCQVLENVGGLTSNRNTSIPVQVAMFLAILSHHKKNRIVSHDYTSSGRTVSKHFHRVLDDVMKAHGVFLVQPEPVPENSMNGRWKWFTGCLGALDGTHIHVRVPKKDKPWYRTRKGEIAINVLGVCDMHLKFIYVLTGWEGSASDSRVLRDAITRPNGFRIPIGCYYLCDNGYTNGEGFLAPYRGVRYHLDDRGEGSALPRNKEEFFNMKHSKARNVVERAFGLFKMCWAILRSNSFYPIRVQNRIIMACCLLQNFIRMEMEIDPLEATRVDSPNGQHHDEVDFVKVVEVTQEWTNWRNELARHMFDEWRRVR